MLTRVLSTVAIGTGVVLGSIGIVAVPLALPVAIGLGALAAIMAACVPPDGRGRAEPVVAGSGRSGGVRAGLGITASLLVLTGLTVVLGAATWVAVVAVLGIAAGRLRARRGAPLRSTPLPIGRDGPRLVETAPPETTAASTAQLCAAWQQTYFAMLDLPAGPQRRGMVEVRQRLLDELERRDPDGFVRWLETGARANSDPSRYLAPER